MNSVPAKSELSSKDLTIAVLTVTAVILLVAFLATQLLMPGQAFGFGQNLNPPGGDYQILTAQLDNTTEMLVIVNHRTHQMNAYGFDLPRGQIVPIQQVDLSRLPTRAGASARPPAERSQRKR